jgi:hypothetical protein
MQKRFFALGCVILLPLIFTTGAFAMKELKLIPKPREYKFSVGEAHLTGNWKIYLPSDTTDDTYAAKCLSDEAKNCFGWELKIATNEPEKNLIVIETCPPQGDEPELFLEQGYLLTIEPEKITIAAPSAVGKYYGVQTLRQIFRNAGDSAIPCLTIRDWPALKWRGISDDISRGQVSLSSDFKTIIRELAFFKKNLYQPYIEDMFIFEADPNIGSTRGAITKKEMAEIVAEAEKNHVTLAPVFECLGHQDRLLSLPENRKYAEIQELDKDPWSFSPVSDDAFQFVTTLIDEIVESVPSPFFHIGGDESFDVGKGTSKKLAKKIGVGRVHAEYFTRLNTYLNERHDRQMMVYADMIENHPEAMAYIPKNCIMVDWHYGIDKPDYPTIAKLKKAGFKNIIASPGIWGWANYFPNYSLGFASIAKFAAVAKKENLMGCVTSSWGDDSAENLRENNMLGYAYSAAAEWETGTPDPERFLRRFAALYMGSDSEILSGALKNLGWLDYTKETYIARIFHRTPRIKPYNKDWLGRMRQLREKMQAARDAINAQRTSVRFNNDWLDTLDHVARRNIYLAERELTMNSIANLLKDDKSGDLSLKEQDEILTSLEKRRNELAQLAGEFQLLWLKRNKYPMLDHSMQRLGKQLAVLQNYIALTKVGELIAQKPPEAVWFWYPDPKPEEEATTGTRYFMRVVDLDEEPVEAILRCWADDKAVIYINGERVFEVTYYDNVRMAHTHPRSHKGKDLFKKGKNYIAIEGENDIGAAGIMFEANITFRDNSTLTITGDDMWRVSRKIAPRWKTREMKGPNVRKVKLIGKGLIKPWDFIDW